MALAVPLSRFTSRVGGGSAFYVRPQSVTQFYVNNAPIQNPMKTPKKNGPNLELKNAALKKTVLHQKREIAKLKAIIDPFATGGKSVKTKDSIAEMFGG